MVLSICFYQCDFIIIQCLSWTKLQGLCVHYCIAPNFRGTIFSWISWFDFWSRKFSSQKFQYAHGIYGVGQPWQRISWLRCFNFTDNFVYISAYYYSWEEILIKQLRPVQGGRGWRQLVAPIVAYLVYHLCSTFNYFTGLPSLMYQMWVSRIWAI